MTEEAAQGKRLFDAERWSEAALILKRVVDGETGDDEGNKQIAQYHLAICLYRLQFYQASYGIFSAIADKPNHLKFNETLLWLAKLATQLPEPADIVERVGKYKRDQIARFNNPQQRDLYWHLNYLLGRYKYRNRNYEEAISLFEMVDKKSKYNVHAQFFSGISYVQLRKSVPAVKSFQRVVTAIEDGAEGVDDESRMRDLAYLSMARTYYSASVRLDEQQRADDRREQTLAPPSSTGTGSTSPASTGSTPSSRSRGRTSWPATTGARSATSTRSSPRTSPTRSIPEADILKAVIYFTICQYDDATTVVARMKKKYEPIEKELEAVLNRFKGEGGEQQFFEFLKDVRTRQGKPVSRRSGRSSRTRSPTASCSEPRVRARPRRGGCALQEGADELPELADRQRRHRRAQPRARSRHPQRRRRSPASATSATSTSSTSTSATRPRSSSTSPPPSATSSTRRS